METDGRVHYLVEDWPAVQEYQLSAGPLSDAYDLQTAASTALRPLVKKGGSRPRHTSTNGNGSRTTMPGFATHGLMVLGYLTAAASS